VDNNLEVITLTKKNLREVLSQNKYWSDSFDAPFSRNKAKWMLNNNRADEADVFAILVYENQTLISFVGLMPDWIKTENGEVKKTFWSQRWWVSAKYENTVLPSYSKNISLSATNNQVIIKFLGAKTEAYYRKQNYTKFSGRIRSIIVFNIDHNLLVYKFNSLKKIVGLLKGFDKFSEKVITLINKTKNNRRIKNLLFEYISSIDENAWSFIEKYCANDIVPKTKEYINWQITNSQYHNLSSGINKPGYKCLLSSISNNIYNLSFLVKKQGKTIGFISANVKDNRFTLRYFLTSDDNLNSCLDALINSFIKTKCTLIQTENGNLAEQIKRRYTSIYTDSRELFSLEHNDIELDFNNVCINDQDGSFF
jgi:hypothetical protein